MWTSYMDGPQKQKILCALSSGAKKLHAIGENLDNNPRHASERNRRFGPRFGFCSPLQLHFLTTKCNFKLR